jgi:hypothetical protein
MFDDSERMVEDGVFEEVAPESSALVPLVPSVHRANIFPLPRPDPTFLAHLIATAEQLPQTRKARRVAPADASSAYRALQPKSQDRSQGAQARSRHVIDT